MRKDAGIDAILEKISLRTKRRKTRDVDQTLGSESLGVAAASTEGDQNDAAPGAALSLFLGRGERPRRKNSGRDGKSGGSKELALGHLLFTAESRSCSSRSALALSGWPRRSYTLARW